MTAYCAFLCDAEGHVDREDETEVQERQSTHQQWLRQQARQHQRVDETERQQTDTVREPTRISYMRGIDSRADRKYEVIS